MQIQAIKTFLLQDFMDSPEILGRVHSVFEHAINFECNDSLITLLCDENVGIPDSIVITYRDFQLLKNIKATQDITLGNKKIIVDRFVINFTNSTNFENDFPSRILASKQEIETRRKLFGFYHTLPERAEIKFAELLVAIKNKNQNDCANILKTLIGLGSGLTPSADDALLGILSVLEFHSKSGIELFDNLASIIYSISENRTTDISRKYFKCACQKRFSLPLINVVRSLFEDDFKFDFPALAKLLNTGHSSGKDTMRGIILAQNLLYKI